MAPRRHLCPRANVWLRALLMQGALGLPVGLGPAWSPRVAFAQATQPEVRLSADRDVAGLGERILLTIAISSTHGSPSDVQLGPTPGFAVRQTSRSPSQSISIVNGVRTDKVGLNVTWSLEAKAEGQHQVGPITFTVDGQRYKTEPIRLRVVPPGQAPRPKPSRPSDPFGGPSPFDLWKGFFDFGDDEPSIQQRDDEPPILDPRWALEVPRGDRVFLHATLDKPRAVVGEQVTLSVLLYVDIYTQGLEFQDVHEATAGDFLQQSLMETDGREKLLGFTEVAGRRYSVRLLRKTALFPLKAGNLSVGPMKVTVGQGRGHAFERDSETLSVRVAEPPTAGRPAGYTVGNVGHFELKAEVTPRQVEQGGAVAVRVELKGSGNAPAKLPVPLRPGAEWLEPEVRDDWKPRAANQLGGTRTFSYVVRTNQTGDLDLGAFVLPYWDPEAKTYETARAVLGTVRVVAGEKPVASVESPPDPVPGLPTPRFQREGSLASSRFWADQPWYPWGLAAAPMSFAIFSLGELAFRRAQRFRRERGTSNDAKLRSRTSEADAACRGQDAAVALGAIVRALETATELLVGLNVRGIAVDTVARELEAQGVAYELAGRVQKILEACGGARFSPEGSDIAFARRQWEEATRALRDLGKLGKG